MKCHRCKGIIPDGEENDFHGQILCEDCYMDLLSPPKMCDPWAVHSAKSFEKTAEALRWKGYCLLLLFQAEYGKFKMKVTTN